MTSASSFLKAFPPDHPHQAVNAQMLAEQIRSAFEIAVPPVLVGWWAQVGSGYFAERELFIFGDESLAGRDSLLEWNSKNYWRKILPSPIDGGPVFFAENCFGSQLGFRWQEGCATGYFLDVDTCEAFKVSDSLDELFGSVLTDRYALTNPELLVGVRAVVGGLADGMHYAPIVSPLVGGRSIPGNYHLETANVHLRTSIATWEATRTGE